MTTSSEPSSLQDQKGLCFQRFLAKFPTAFCLNERLGRGRLSGQWAECGIETCLNFATHSIFHPSHDTAAAFWKRQFRILLRSNLLSNSVITSFLSEVLNANGSWYGPGMVKKFFARKSAWTGRSSAAWVLQQSQWTSDTSSETDYVATVQSHSLQQKDWSSPRWLPLQRTVLRPSWTQSYLLELLLSF